MPHHMRDGVVVGWGPTAREIDRLASRFTSVRHVACLHPGAAPGSAIPYQSRNVTLVPIPPSGADGFLGKVDVLRTSPAYIRTILRELRDADMVHVRAPAHVALIAILLLGLRRRPQLRWFKYAGNWSPSEREPLSYNIQRWLLSRRFHRGVVTVNGDWPHQPPWIRTFFNPSLDTDDIARGTEAARSKLLTMPMHLLYVGRIETPKGAGRALRVLEGLVQRGIDADLELIGDGEEREKFEQLATTMNLQGRVVFRGWLPPNEVNDAYRRSHIMLLPTSASEGWPKVLSEGMAYGVVPVTSTVSSIPQYISQLETGAAHHHDDIGAYVDTIAGYVANPKRWESHSQSAVAATDYFSFGFYLKAVDRLLADLPSISSKRFA